MDISNYSILFYRAGACNEKRVLDNLRRIVKEVYIVDKVCKNNDMDGELASALFISIHTNKPDMIISVDYYPIVAEVANTVGIAYISWIIDSPHYTLYSSTSRYVSSYIFHFDREECERLKKMGRPQVYHQPLATDPDYFMKRIAYSKRIEESEICFLGSSYQNEYDYFEKQSGLSEYQLGYLEGILKAQSAVYGAAIIPNVIPENLQESLLEACDIRFPETYDIPRRLIAANIIEKKLSVRERRRMIDEVAYEFGITLYSEKKTKELKGVRYMGYADYETEMPIVFHNSHINLNLTLRSIHSGIPLRALDIIGCRGFLLSNYQPELAEWFEDGNNIAMFGSMEELLDKARWYLEHEEDRKKIVVNGYKIVCKSFTYKNALTSVLQKAYIGR